MVNDRVPYRFDIHPVIAMTEPVSDAADIMPRQAGAPMLRIRSEPYRRLADQQKLALDRGNRLRVSPKRLQIHATHELVMSMPGYLARKVWVP
jgi:hypothetical protein